MKKKILSLVLVLTMILSLAVANMSFVGAEEPANQVNFKYYSDEALTQEITKVDIGDYFYACMSLKNFEKLLSFGFALEYDKDVIELTKFSEDVAVSHKANTTDYTGTYGFKTSNVGIFAGSGLDALKAFNIQASDVNPFVDTEAGVITLAAITKMNTEVAVMDEKPLAIFRFKAKAQGKTGFAFTNTYDADRYPDGYKFMLKDDYLDIAVDFGKLSVGQEPIGAPANVALSDKVVTWDAVSDASGYNLKITVERDNGKNEILVDNVQGLSYTLDSDIIGKVTVEVSAIAADEDKADSGYVKSNSEEYKVTLADPVISWDGKTLKWNEVENALEYHVVLTENGIEVYNEKVTDLFVAFGDSLIKEPVAKPENKYKATVQAIGDSYAINSGVASIEKVTFGKVAVPTNLSWNGYEAVWEASADSAFVSGYSVSLYGPDGLIKTDVTDTTSYDFTSEIKGNAGVYHYEIYAVGKSVVGGDYENSDLKISSDKIEKVKLEPVYEINWNERTLSWESDNVYKGAYTLTVYKWNSIEDKYDEIGKYSTEEKEYDFNGIIAEGKYKVEIIAKGNNYIYLDSELATTDKSFIAQLPIVGNPVLSSAYIATWDAVEGAEGYIVTLKLNENYKVKEVEVGKDVTQYDFTAFANKPGKYTFEVIAKGNGIDYSSSVPAKSNEEEKIIPESDKKGILEVKAYTDEALATPATDVAVGESFYVAITLDNDAIADYNLTAYNLPVKFDPAVVKVADANGMTAANGIIGAEDLEKNGIYIQENGFIPVLNDNYVSIDNEKGLVKFLAQSNAAVTITAPTKLLVIKFVAAAKATGTQICFADSSDSAYDATAPAGAEFAFVRTLIFPKDENAVASVNITKGQLPTPVAPVFDNNANLSWNAVGGAVGYKITLYYNNSTTPLAVIDVNDGTQTSINLSSYMVAYGTYKATIQAIANGMDADDSGVSSESNVYTKAQPSSGDDSTPSGSIVGTLPGATPQKPSTGDKEKVEFIDIEGHWAEEDIIELEEYKVIEGYGDKTFRPDFGITRAEFTKMMVVALGLEVKENAENTYIDTKDHWSRDYVAVATEAGIVNGIGEDMFAPDVIITREQMAAIIWRIADRVEVANDSTYADKDDVSQYAKIAVEFVTDKGYMIGFENNTFRPTEQTNRAQAATVILRLIKSGFFKAYK